MVKQNGGGNLRTIPAILDMISISHKHSVVGQTTPRVGPSFPDRMRRESHPTARRLRLKGSWRRRHASAGGG